VAQDINERVNARTEEKIPLVYILAASHSGSTLLAMLLNSHPEVVSVGELKATSLGDVDRYRCSCQKLIKECPFWLGISKGMADRGFDFKIWDAGTDVRSGASDYIKRLLRPLHRGRVLELCRDAALGLSSVWRQHLAKVQARNAALMECILKRAGRKVIVDSSKIGIRLKYLLKDWNLDIRILHLVRDGRAVAMTYTDPARFADAKDPRLRGGGWGGTWESERRSIKEAAYEWLRSNEEAEEIVSNIKEPLWLRITYEDLCANTQAALAKMFQFIGVEARSKPLDFRGVPNHIIGNGMRLDSSSEISLDDRWRRELPGSYLKAFDAIAGDMNRRLGYE